MGRAAAMIAAAIALGGCGGAALLTGTRPATTSRSTATAQPGPSSAAYLASLEREQQKLAAAERRLPRHAATPVALSRAISLLAGAIARLAADLRTLHAPASVQHLHERLIAVMGSYAARLQAAARDARRSSGEPRAASELLSATSDASRQFSLTVNQIDRTLTP